MAWTTPRTWVVGEIVTKAMLDEQIKANEDYLKTEVDKLNTVTQNSPGRALNTVYQNTSGKIRLSTVTVIVGDTNPSSVLFYVGVSTAGLVDIGGVRQLNTIVLRAPISFIVPPNYYCKASTVEGTAALINWADWDLH